MGRQAGSTTVRVTQQTARTLRELAALSGRSMQEVMAEAVETYRRQQSRQAALQRLRARFASVPPTRRLADELIEERREEARRETL